MDGLVVEISQGISDTTGTMTSTSLVLTKQAHVRFPPRNKAFVFLPYSSFTFIDRDIFIERDTRQQIQATIRKTEMSFTRFF